MKEDGRTRQNNARMEGLDDRTPEEKAREQTRTALRTRLIGQLKARRSYLNSVNAGNDAELLVAARGLVVSLPFAEAGPPQPYLRNPIWERIVRHNIFSAAASGNVDALAKLMDMGWPADVHGSSIALNLAAHKQRLAPFVVPADGALPPAALMAEVGRRQFTAQPETGEPPEPQAPKTTLDDEAIVAASIAEGGLGAMFAAAGVVPGEETEGDRRKRLNPYVGSGSYSKGAGAGGSGATFEDETAHYFRMVDSVGEQALRDVRKRHRYTTTPFHLACAGGHMPAARLLLARGADPTARDFSGRTPLHDGAAGGHLHVVSWLCLIVKGVKPRAVDALDRTPLDLVQDELRARRELVAGLGGGSAGSPERGGARGGGFAYVREQSLRNKDDLARVVVLEAEIKRLKGVEGFLRLQTDVSVAEGAHRTKMRAHARQVALERAAARKREAARLKAIEDARRRKAEAEARRKKLADDMERSRKRKKKKKKGGKKKPTVSMKDHKAKQAAKAKKNADLEAKRAAAAAAQEEARRKKEEEEREALKAKVEAGQDIFQVMKEAKAEKVRKEREAKQRRAQLLKARLARMKK